MRGPGSRIGGGPRGSTNVSRASLELRRGLVARLRAQSLSGLANADLVSSWSSSIGSIVATSSGSARPAYSANGWSDGGPAVSFAGAARHLRIDDVAALSSGGSKPGPMSVAVVSRLDAAAVAAPAACSFGLGGPSAYRAQLYAANGSASTWVSQPVGDGLTIAGAALHSDEDSVQLVSWDGASSKLYTNGVRATGDLAWNPWSATAYAAIGSAIAAAGTVTNPFSGLIREVLVWDRALGDAGWAALASSYRSACRHRLVGLGDSITHGYGASASWLDLQTPSLSCLGSGTYRGVPTKLTANGRTIEDVEAALATDFASAPYSAYVPSVISLWVGTNNLAAGDTAAEAAAKYWSLYSTIKTARPHDLVLVVPPLLRAGYLAQSAELRSILLSSWRSQGADDLWDPASLPAFATTSSSGYQVDGIHPNDAGHAALAADFAARGFPAVAVDRMLRRMLA